MLLSIPVLKWVVELEPDPLKSIIYVLNSFLVAPTVREAIKTSLPGEINETQRQDMS